MDDFLTPFFISGGSIGKGIEMASKRDVPPVFSATDDALKDGPRTLFPASRDFFQRLSKTPDLCVFVRRGKGFLADAVYKRQKDLKCN